MYGGNGLVPLLRVNRSYSGFYAVHQAGCSLGNDLLCVWSHIAICDCSITSYKSCINPNMLFPLLWHLKPDTAPKLITLTEHLTKGCSSESYYWSTIWNNFFTLYSLVSNSFLVLPLPHTKCLLSDQKSRGTFCCPYLIFPLGLVAKAQTHWNLSLV